MNIYDFLKTGKLKGLKTGDTEYLVYQKFDKKVLGKKLYTDSQYTDMFYFYAFGGALEICFVFHEVSHFTVTPHNHFFFLEYQQQKHWLDQLDNFHEFVELLHTMNIGWRFLRRYCRDKQLAIITEHHVVAFFDYTHKDSVEVEFQVNGNDRFEQADKV
ncbi:hypothetical protein [Microscilla marina]|uniref:Uncharacterized protein n=1 Tax=Microscilla marina ATCC 23134 TaxID=313606 RepID=A2A0B2_MICM2|nr:hypothetical protein [Microscilla marina]EAY23928.1 hypothetical protein M23134_00358 [Microscilla marina ATCC 23134]